MHTLWRSHLLRIQSELQRDTGGAQVQPQLVHRPDHFRDDWSARGGQCTADDQPPPFEQNSILCGRLAAVSERKPIIASKLCNPVGQLSMQSTLRIMDG